MGISHCDGLMVILVTLYKHSVSLGQPQYAYDFSNFDDILYVKDQNLL